MLSECLISPKFSPIYSYQFNLFNIVTFYLRLTELASPFAMIAGDQSGEERYVAIYAAQETALRIAANCGMSGIY